MKLFYGEPIEKFAARLGTVDIEEEDFLEMRPDVPVVMVVVGVPRGASINRSKDGEWKQSNAIAIETLLVATGEQRAQLIETFNLAAGSEALFEIPMKASRSEPGEPEGRSEPSEPPEVTTDDIPGADDEPGSDGQGDDDGWDDGAFDPDNPDQLGELQAPANGSAVADRPSVPQLEEPMPDMPPIPVHRSRDPALARFMDES